MTNSAIIVFREGLEGVLILAAITASMVGLRRRLRRPVFVGALAGLGVSVITWVLAQTLLRSLERYGEKLEAVVGLVAIGVLLLITNWFFHKVYWSEWIAKFHRQRKRYEKLEKRGFISAQAVGPVRARADVASTARASRPCCSCSRCSSRAGTATVLEGAGLGLAMTLAVGAVTFYFQRKLPYKKMLIVTGVFIGFVLVVMVGQTVRTMQGTGWLPITPIDITLPYWAGAVVRRLPDGRDDRRADRRRGLRDRLLLPGPGDEGQAPAPAREGAAGSRSSARRGGANRERERQRRARSARTGTRSRVADPSVRPWRAATSAIIVGVERAEPLEHQLAARGRRRSRSSTAGGAGTGAGSRARCGGRSAPRRALTELPLDLAHLVVRGLELLGDVARRVRGGDVEDLLADQVEHVGDERVARARVAGRDQLHRAHAAVGDGQVVAG